MFRDMRRKNQLLSLAESEEILNSCTSGVLALAGDDDYPYTVPLSYVYTGDKLYFHCAKTGHKIDAIEKCNKASFCVIGMDNILPEKYTTIFKSVVVFGKINILKTDEEMREPIKLLSEKFVKGNPDGIEKEYNQFKNNMYMLEFNIEHITGKQCIELAKQEK